MGANRRSWRNILVNPKYQLRYVFWLTACGFLLTALNASILYFYVRENYFILVDLSPMTAEVKTQLQSELNHIMMNLAGVSFLFLLVIALLGLIFSHRTAGPLYHFKRVFDSIAQGQKQARIRLRPEDDFHEVALSCNQMLESVLGSAQKPTAPTSTTDTEKAS